MSTRSFLLATTLILLSFPAYAQTAPSAGPQQSSNTADDEKMIVVTATRVRTSIADVPTSISVITEEELAVQSQISRDIFDTLQLLIPGIGANQEMGNSCNIKLRGRTAAFLVNGVPLGQDLRPSSCNDLSTVNQHAVQRIEVSRGATAVYGYGAPGGVVNVLTRRATRELEVDAALNVGLNPSHVGESWLTEAYLGVGQKTGRFDYYVGAAFTDINSRRDPDGEAVVGQEARRLITINLSAGLEVGAGELRVTGNFNHEDPREAYGSTLGASRRLMLFPTATGELTPNPDRASAFRRTWVTSVSYENPDILGNTLNLTLYAADQEEKNRDNFGRIGAPSFQQNTTFNERTGARLTISSPLGKLADTEEAILIWGGDYLSNRFYRPQFSLTGVLIGFASPEVFLSTAAVFGQLRVPVGNLILSGGVRHEQFWGRVGSEGFAVGISGAGVPGKVPNFSSTIFNAGAVYQLSPRSEVYAGFSQGTEVTQLGSAARGVSNPALLNLQPAKSNQYELGARYRGDGFRFEGAIYRSTSKLASRLVPEPSCVIGGGGTCFFVPLRQPERIWGFELSGEVELNDNIDVGGVFTYQTGETEDPTTGAERSISYAILTPPRLTAYVQGEWRGWQMRLQGVNFFPTDGFNQSTAFGQGSTGSQFLADAFIGREIGPGKATLSASNLFNKTYVNVIKQAFNNDSNYTKGEGARVTLGYKVKF